MSWDKWPQTHTVLEVSDPNSLQMTRQSISLSSLGNEEKWSLPPCDSFWKQTFFKVYFYKIVQQSGNLIFKFMQNYACLYEIQLFNWIK